MPEPAFFIVGAAKSGTTALCSYLNQHPAIYIPQRKEPHFFGSDLAPLNRPQSVAEYCALFDEGQGKLCGEGSVFYLFSHQAAQEIYQFNPEARIIIMLRNPVDVMYSLHNQRLYNGAENMEDFAQALAAEDDRHQGRRLVGRFVSPEFFDYTNLTKFTPQVERYFQTFGRAQVHIILYDDFKRDPARVYRQTLAFLGVDADFQVAFQVVNANKYWRSQLLAALIRTPSAPLRILANTLVPHRTKVAIKKFVRRKNTVYRSRPPMNPDLRRRLLLQCTPDIEQLGMLIGRDLTHWYEPPDREQTLLTAEQAPQQH